MYQLLKKIMQNNFGGSDKGVKYFPVIMRATSTMCMEFKEINYNL